MIVTARASRFLRSLPAHEAVAVLDSLATAPGQPVAAGLFQHRHTFPDRRCVALLSAIRHGEPVVLAMRYVQPEDHP